MIKFLNLIAIPILRIIDTCKIFKPEGDHWDFMFFHTSIKVL